MEILTGLLVGTAYAAAPGPIIVETLRQGMRGGMRASLAVQGGSILGPLLYGGIALHGAGAFLQQDVWQPVLGFGGMLLLLYLGLTTIRERDVFSAPTLAIAPVRSSTRGAVATGAMLSLANPLDIAFWLSIGGAALQQPGPEGLTFMGAFVAGCVTASLLAATVAAFWHARLSGAVTRALSWASGLALIGFGLHLGIAAAGVAR